MALLALPPSLFAQQDNTTTARTRVVLCPQTVLNATTQGIVVPAKNRLLQIHLRQVSAAATKLLQSLTVFVSNRKLAPLDSTILEITFVPPARLTVQNALSLPVPALPVKVRSNLALVSVFAAQHKRL